MCSINNISNTIRKHKSIFSNILSLWTLQIFGYIFPLIVLPYVLPIIWVENFGKISFAISFVALFMMLINYGFNLTATQEISLSRMNKSNYSEIFFGVIFVKILLFLFSTFLFVGIIFNFSLFAWETSLYLIAYWSLVWEIFFPIWMFQWMEKMKYITYINVTIKFLSFWAILYFIQEKSHYLMYPLILTISSVVSGIIWFVFAIKIFDIQFVFPKRNKIKKILWDGWHIFISGVFSSLYTSAIPFFLGIFTNNIVVWYYAWADKIIKAVQSLISPVTQALFPTISHKLESGHNEAILYIKKVTKYILLFTSFLSLVLFFFAEYIVFFLLWEEFQKSILLVQILSPIPIIIGLAIVFWHFVMIHFGYKKELSKIYMVFSLLSLIITFPLIYLFSDIWAATSIVITEVLITFSMYVFLKRNNIVIL